MFCIAPFKTKIVSYFMETYLKAQRDYKNKSYTFDNCSPFKIRNEKKWWQQKPKTEN